LERQRLKSNSNSPSSIFNESKTLKGISTIKIVILEGSSASTSSLLNFYKTIKKLEREL
jgi:hypothetical protein